MTPKSPLVWKCDHFFSDTQEDTYMEEEQFETEEEEQQQGHQIPEEEINQILENARQKAEQEAQEIIDNAQAEKEKILKEAKEKGYQDGYQQGKDEGLQEVEAEKEQLISEAKHLLVAAKQDYQDTLKELEPEICRLITEIAEKLISDRLEDQQELVSELVKNGIERMTEQNKVIIRAHPDDYAQLEADKDQILEGFSDLRIELKQDDDLKPGAPILFGENGHIELELSRQIDELRRALGQVINSGN